VSAFVLAGALTACGDKNEQPGPQQYTVIVRYTATNLQPNGEDAGASVGARFTDESASIVKGIMLNTAQGSDETEGDFEQPELIGSDKVAVELAFPYVDSAAEGKALPATTAIKAEILVEGKVKKTLVLDKNTAFDPQTGTLHVKQTFQVKEL
jgi:hypothetical protein